MNENIKKYEWGTWKGSVVCLDEYRRLATLKKQMYGRAIYEILMHSLCNVAEVDQFIASQNSTVSFISKFSLFVGDTSYRASWKSAGTITSPVSATGLRACLRDIGVFRSVVDIPEAYTSLVNISIPAVMEECKEEDKGKP